jgi:protein-S-isoprenylcysteine O-methyltransferase Ste14
VIGGVAAAATAFGLAAVVIVALMFTAAFTVSRAQDATVARIRATAPAIKRWGGAVLVGVGLWFISLAVFADFFAEIFPV